MKHPPYQPGNFYHIYNHANGRENLFECDENYHYFQRKYKEKLNGVVETLAYCLMPNHFHLLIQVRNENTLLSFLNNKKQRLGEVYVPRNLSHNELLDFIVQRQFHNFLSGYAKAFNKYHNRKDSLLRQNTRRKMVHDENYLMNVVAYVHLNPVIHHFTSLPEDWPHSSYNQYLKETQTMVSRNRVMVWFGGNRELFVNRHLEKINNAINTDWES